MSLLAIILLLVGLGMIGRYFYLKHQANQESEKRGFLVTIGIAALLFWLFGGSGILIIGGILLLVFLL